MELEIKMLPFKCEICQKTCTSDEILQAHLDVHNRLKPFKCSICEKMFSTDQSLQRHLQRHSVPRPYKCPECEKFFSRKQELQIHVQVHAVDKPYNCDICEKAFAYKHVFKMHLTQHTGLKLYQCDICEKRFSRKCYLKVHHQLHIEDKPYKCNICESTFTYESNLRTHHEVHTKSKTFKCNVCEKTFSRNENLKRHQAMHAGAKLYECNMCDKTFSRKDHLQNHHQIHAENKLYRCNVCEKSFSRNDNLKRHFKVHKRVKPLICKLCQKVFFKKCHLKVHLQQVHATTKNKPKKLTITKENSPNESPKCHNTVKLEAEAYEEACEKIKEYTEINLEEHAEMKLYQCEFCKEMFSPKYKQDMPYTCQICEKNYVSEEYSVLPPINKTETLPNKTAEKHECHNTVKLESEAYEEVSEGIKRDLEMNLEEHAEMKSYQWQCEVCEEMFSHKCKQDTLYVCEMCEITNASEEYSSLAVIDNKIEVVEAMLNTNLSEQKECLQIKLDLETELLIKTEPKEEF